MTALSRNAREGLWHTDRVPAGDPGQTYRSVWSYMMETPFRQDYLVVSGLRTRFANAGLPENPALILLHGTGGHWEAFMANLPILSQHFNCYAIDMLGCGFTDKPDKPYEVQDYADHVRAFMDLVEVKKASFIGVSLGTWVASYLAIHHQNLVDKMILVSPTGYFPMPGLPQTVAMRRESAVVPSWSSITSVLQDLYYDPSTVIDDLVAVRQRVYSGPEIPQIMPRMLTLFDPEVRARNNFDDSQWQSIKAPTLIVEHVDADDIFLKTARRIKELIPGARMVAVPECAHWAQFEQPHLFNEVATDFLAHT